MTHIRNDWTKADYSFMFAVSVVVLNQSKWFNSAVQNWTNEQIEWWERWSNKYGDYSSYDVYAVLNVCPSKKWWFFVSLFVKVWHVNTSISPFECACVYLFSVFCLLFALYDVFLNGHSRLHTGCIFCLSGYLIRIYTVKVKRSNTKGKRRKWKILWNLGFAHAIWKANIKVAWQLWKLYIDGRARENHRKK